MKRIHYIVILAILLFSCEKAITPYQAQNFIKYFGSGYESKGNDVIQLSDGNYAFTGYDVTSSGDYQIFAAKVDKYGNQIWSNTWGISDREEGKVIKEVSDGLLIAGTALKSNGITQSFLYKVDLNGEHDLIWEQKYGGVSSSLKINDILLTDNNIYITGQSYTANENSSDYYISKLDLNGTPIWERSFYPGTGSYVSKAFVESDNVMLIGTLGPLNKVTVLPVSQITGYPVYSKEISIEKQLTGDAILSSDNLFILVNDKSQAATSLKVLKLDNTYKEKWYDAIPSTEGKSFSLLEDGSILICGEQIIGAEARIYFATVDPTGVISHGDEYFRTLPGYAGKIIETNDKGVIMVGTTGSTYGTMVQLIKTDKDLFLLKP